MEAEHDGRPKGYNVRIEKGKGRERARGGAVAREGAGYRDGPRALNGWMRSKQLPSGPASQARGCGGRRSRRAKRATQGGRWRNR